jgi:hypothetical protein
MKSTIRVSTLKASGLLLIAAGIAACAQEVEIPPSPVYSVKTIVANHLDGVGGADCPSGYRIVGGGCWCRGVGDVLFSSGPVSNSYLCACYDGFMDNNETVEATALCLGSNTPGTLQQGISERDATVLAALDELRAQRQIHHR